METHSQRVQQLHKSATGKLVLVLNGPEENFCEQGMLQPLFHSGECVGVVLFAGQLTEQPVKVVSNWVIQIW